MHTDIKIPTKFGPDKEWAEIEESYWNVRRR
jgi:hypothetical protein